MKHIIYSLLFTLTITNLMGQKVILNESFKGQRFTDDMVGHSQKNKFSDTPVANFSFSKMGQNDESSLRVSIKQTEKRNVKLLFKNITLNKNKTYQVSYYIKSRTGSGKIKSAVFNHPTDQKYVSLFVKNLNLDKNINNSWQKKQFKFKATKKNKDGVAVDLKNLTFVINFTGLSRGIYLLDDIMIKQLD